MTKLLPNQVEIMGQVYFKDHLPSEAQLKAKLLGRMRRKKEPQFSYWVRMLGAMYDFFAYKLLGRNRHYKVNI